MAGYAAIGALRLSGRLPSAGWKQRNDDLVKTTVDILQEGRYVLLYADYFHINGTAQYVRKHFRHDCLLFDFNLKRRIFKGALYNRKKNLGLGRISFDQLMEACLSPFARGEKCYDYCRGNLYSVFEVHPGASHEDSLDQQDIGTQLKCYLESTDLAGRSLNKHKIAQLCLLYRQTQPPVVFGLNIYDHIKEYITKAIESGNIRHALRVTRLLLEHKKLMKIRLSRLAQEGVVLSSPCLEKWDEIVAAAGHVHLRMVAAGERNDASLVSSFSSDFAKLKEKERLCLGYVCSRII